uniref:Uncharacterized protein n=1 Tax=Onchocerca volvulus TaxID=6282 RepID=A0A8R1TR29_ONCVO
MLAVNNRFVIIIYRPLRKGKGVIAVVGFIAVTYPPKLSFTE